MELKEVTECKNVQSGKLKNDHQRLQELFDFFTRRKKQFAPEMHCITLGIFMTMTKTPCKFCF
jgi:hypothetical protein